MRKLIVFIAQSLDGYIATKNDNVSWLDNIDGLNDNGYTDFYNTIDTIIMGKRTYDWINKNTEEYPYKGKNSIVITSQNNIKNDNISIINKNVLEEIKHLKNQKGKDIWVLGGGKLITSFLSWNIIDELRITVAPIILGSGIPLFDKLDNNINLTFLKTTRYNQFVELRYKVNKNENI